MFFQCNMSMQVIVHRTESDRVANGIRSDGERNLIGWRTESDRAANASGGKTKETTAPNKVLWFP